MSPSNDQRNAVQAEMAVGRPAANHAQFPHQGKSVGIGQCQFLISEFLHDTARALQFVIVETADRQAWQGIDERQKPYRPLLIVSAQEPPWKLSDPSGNAIKAEVSTQQSVFPAINNIIDTSAGAMVTGLHETREPSSKDLRPGAEAPPGGPGGRDIPNDFASACW
jgi:hypothetical protein